MTSHPAATPVSPALASRYRQDGVVCIPRALSPDTLALARAAYDWSLANPGPSAATLPAKGSGTFYQDLANPAALSAYRELVEDTEIGDIIATLWQKPAVWFMYEQVFVKTGGDTRRTPWHQDAPYLPVRGADLAVMWLSFEPVPQEQALEFVAGSHRGTLYDGSRFDPDDDTAPLYGTLPRLPDIEARRDSFPIVSWETAPGDVLVFHPAVLHGGGATTADSSRHTLSLRFFGDDAVVAARPGSKVRVERDPTADLAVHPLTRMRARPDGTPFRDPAFPAIRPRAAGVTAVTATH
jgi:ectoine hydroxylase-related dioxygenase (phytanoyl-CoA dioxygenase family)